MFQSIADWFTGLGTVGMIAQGIGVIAAVIAIVSFQQRTQKMMVAFQFGSNMLWMIHMLLLGAYAGALLNTVGTMRATVFYFRNSKKWARHPIWVWVFIALSAGCTVISWQLGDGWLALLPFCGMVLTTVAYSLSDPFRIRLLNFINSPFWLAYNVLHLSIPGIVTEASNMVSIFVAFLRLDLPAHRVKKSREAAERAEREAAGAPEKTDVPAPRT